MKEVIQKARDMNYLLAGLLGGWLMLVVEPRFGITVGVLACLLLGVLMGVVYGICEALNDNQS